MTITPGTQLSLGQKLTRSLANLLGTPTVSLDDGDVTTAKVAAKAITPALLSDESRSLLNGFKNKIINGKFEFARRNNLVNNPTTGTFCFDRWRVWFDGTVGTTNIDTIASNVVGYPTLEDYSSTAVRWLQSVAGAGDTFRYLEQRVENARTFSGKNVSISFFAAITSGLSYGVELVRVYGTGGSPSTSEVLYTTTIAGSAGWAKQELTTMLTSVQGKSFGSNGDSYLALRFKMPVNATFDFYLDLVQFELGSVASAFEQRDSGTERILCARYYQRSYVDGVYANASSNFGVISMLGSDVDEAHGAAVFSTPMRVTPTIVIYSNSGVGGAGSVGRVGVGDVTGVIAAYTSIKGFPRIQKTGGMVAAQLYNLQYTADAEL